MSMEHSLKCNELKCRKELKGSALVTTCSHIYCIECANNFRLTSAQPGARVCPTCETHLSNPDDAVITNLNPSEDYKTSVLSGLSPSVILDCAARAMNFWEYQSTAELEYTDFRCKTLNEKYANLNAHLDRIVLDANAQLTGLREKVQSLQTDQQTLRRKNEELTHAYKEKSRKEMQTRELYDKMKRRAMLGQVQDAASEAVDDSIQASVNQYSSQHETSQRQPPPLFAGTRASEAPQPMRTTLPQVAMTPGGNRGGPGNAHVNIFGGQDTRVPVSTPLHGNRQRLPNLGVPLTNNLGMANQQAMRHPSQTPRLNHMSPSSRSPLGGISGNFAGYGMSAGVKYSQPMRMQSVQPGDLRQPSVQPRVAQRPASTLGQAFLGNPNASTHNLQNNPRYY